MNRFFCRQAFYRALLLAFFFAILPFQQAFADAQADARALASQGNWHDALIATNRYLSDHPNDASMLFLKGLILTQQGKPDDAIDAFKRLTEKHPSLPEAYNNLAVLYADQGKYEKARATLEAGMRTSPAYATTYENLGAVYAMLSSQAYEKALQKKNGSAPKTQLAFLRSFGTDAASTKVGGAILALAPPQKPAAAVPAASVTLQASAPSASPSTSPAASKPATGNKEDERAIAKALDDWAAAWSARDVKKYLSFYAKDFKTPRGKARKAWEEERRGRILGKKRIHVKVSAPHVSLSGNSAKVTFKQTYSSNSFSSTTGKTVMFVKESGGWKIRQELSN